MNVGIDKFLNSYKTISVKYSLLTRLQLFSYNLKQMELPYDAEWSTLKNFIGAGSSYKIVTVVVSGSHN